MASIGAAYIPSIMLCQQSHAAYILLSAQLVYHHAGTYNVHVYMYVHACIHSYMY